MGEAIADVVTTMLLTRGIDYPPAAGDNRWLWCLGGPELYRRPFPEGVDGLETHLNADTCVDLNLYVCDEHEVVSVDVFPFDLVPEWGGSGPDDPRQSESVALGSRSQAAAAVPDRVEGWLDRVLMWPTSD